MDEALNHPKTFMHTTKVGHSSIHQSISLPYSTVSNKKVSRAHLTLSIQAKHFDEKMLLMLMMMTIRCCSVRHDIAERLFTVFTATQRKRQNFRLSSIHRIVSLRHAPPSIPTTTPSLPCSSQTFNSVSSVLWFSH